MNSLIDQSASKPEGETINELKKQIFLTIQVKTAIWDGESALIVLIEDVTDWTQSKFMQTHNDEKEQQHRDAENFKATASHELRTPIKMAIFLLNNLIT